MTGQAKMDADVAVWRAHLQSRPGISAGDADELEDHLRGHLDDLIARGLTPDEAFLVAIKRVGVHSELARDYAQEHSDRLWKHLVGSSEPPSSSRPLLITLGFAVLAGLAVQLPLYLSRGWASPAPPLLPLTVAVVGLGLVVAGYFWWLRRPVLPGVVAATLAALATLLAARLAFPFPTSAFSDTAALQLLHAPIALVVIVGASYLGSSWRDTSRRMDYLRFLGEAAIYYTLLALGGGVLLGLTAGVFNLVGVDATPMLTQWVLPLGVGGAVIVAAWLVEAKKSVIENMAPVLTAVFTPLFTLVQLAFLGAMTVTGRLVDLDRNALIVIDLLLVVVTGLLLFSASARPADAAPRGFDWLQIALVASALMINVFALVAMAGRISEFGVSPNKLAALGENVILAVHLAVSGLLYLGFLRGKRPFRDLVGWQGRFLPVIGLWAAVVVLVFPPVFGFR